MHSNTYKLFQLSEVLIGKYGFNQIMIQNIDEEYAKHDSTWLSNFDNQNYNLIRITLNKASLFMYDKEYVNNYIDYLATTYNKHINFLDIHIDNEPYDDTNEEYDHINLDENFADGKNVFDVFPDIYSTIHTVNNANEEIKKISSKLIEVFNTRKVNKSRKYPIATFVIIGICTIMYLISVFFSRRYTASATYVLLGADYKTFSLGLKQFWRLFTCAFIHGGFLHYFVNMYSLLNLGSYVEREYGSLRFLLVLFVSILCGSLSQSILFDNTLCVGISAGLYGLMSVLVLDIFNKGFFNIRTMGPILLINLGINFMYGTAFVAHLGGLLAGVVIYLIFRKENKLGPIILTCTLLISLMIKYLSTSKIGQFYPGTDLEVVNIFKDLGLNRYATNLFTRLLEVYAKYGG